MPRKAKVLIEVTPAMAQMLLSFVYLKRERLAPWKPNQQVLNKLQHLAWDLVADTHPEDGPHK